MTAPQGGSRDKHATPRASKAGQASKARSDPRLQRLLELVSQLPEAEPAPFGSHTTFRVGKQVFGYFLDNHHGDGRVALVIKVQKGENEFLAVSETQRFYRPAYLFRAGWISFALDVRPIPWSRVAQLLRASYALQAPKRLAGRLEKP